MTPASPLSLLRK